jgi:AcrR family transcriptional regulator
VTLTSKQTENVEKMIRAAGRLFARQGYHGTTTREIADLAGVTENTLYRHFDHKEDMFWSSLRMYSVELKLRPDVMRSIERGESLQVVLPKIVDLFANTVNYNAELIGLIAAAFLELRPKADDFCLQNLSPTISIIHNYVVMSIRSGNLRDLDSTMLTSAMIMTALAHQGIYSLIDGKKPVYSTSLEAQRARSRFWLDLLSPRASGYQLETARAQEEPQLFPRSEDCCTKPSDA